MSAHRAFVSLLLMVSVTGCHSSKVAVETTGTTDATGTSSATMTSGHVETSSAESSIDVDDDGGELDCPSLSDVTGSPVTVRIRNERDEPILVESAPCWLIPYSLTWPNELTQGSLVRPCATCSEVVAGGCCSFDCSGENALLLAPGAQYEEIWSGTLYVNASIPSTCSYPNSDLCGPACRRGVAADAGPYTFETRFVAAVLGCGEGNDCECGDASKDWCFLVASEELFESRDVDARNATIAFPEENVVELVID